MQSSWFLNIRVILGLYGDNGKENGSYYIIIEQYRVYYWDYMGMMEKKMEVTILGYILLFCGLAIHASIDPS